MHAFCVPDERDLKIGAKVPTSLKGTFG